MHKKILLVCTLFLFTPSLQPVKIPDSPLSIGGVLVTGSFLTLYKSVKEYKNARDNGIAIQTIVARDFMTPLVVARKSCRYLKKYKKVIPWAALTVFSGGLGARFILKGY